MSKITIFGAGSIGCYLGGRLLGGEHDVHFIGRARYAEAIGQNGLTLTHFSKPPQHADRVNFHTSPEALAGSDIILLAVKSQDTQAAAKMIAKHARAEVSVVSLQNGVSNAPALRAILPDANIVPAVVPFNVTSTAPGTFHCGTDGALLMGTNAPHELGPAFAAGGQAAEVIENIEGAQWAKLIVNLSNGFNTLSGGPLLKGMMSRDYRRALILQLQEAVDIAAAAEIDVSTFNGRSPAQMIKIMGLPNWLYKIIMQRIVRIDATARSSMLDDLEMGRACEIDYLQGEIIRQANLLGRDAPVSEWIMSEVTAAFAAGKSPKYSGEKLQSALLKLTKNSA